MFDGTIYVNVNNKKLYVVLEFEMSRSCSSSAIQVQNIKTKRKEWIDTSVFERDYLATRQNVKEYKT